MTIELHTPGVDELPTMLATLASWQQDDVPFQLHPGDIGWHWRNGAEATAGAVRAWHRDGELVALGLLDGTNLLRLALAPEVMANPDVARTLVADFSDPARGVLPAGAVDLEIPHGVALHDALDGAGWVLGDPWPVMRHDFTTSLDHGLQVVTVGPDEAPTWAHVHGAAWGRGPGDEQVILGRWHQMASGPAFASARCLLGYDEDDNPVATVTVWSAGQGRPGVLEPMGVHPDHRGRGHGRAMNVAGASVLQEMGASAATVCTPGSNPGGVAAYNAAGYATQYERFDRRREG